MRAAAVILALLSTLAACGERGNYYAPTSSSDVDENDVLDLPTCNTRDDVGNKLPRKWVEPDYLKFCEELEDCYMRHDCYHCTLNANLNPTWERAHDAECAAMEAP